ncbi:MAG: heme ABC exporter ATP-binding protein CcmA [Vicinamibacterales bacterium]
MDFDTLTFADVTRNFGRRRALNRVSLSCRAGEIVALLGPNGAGKSTLLSIAATLIEPTSGEVRYGDRLAPAGGASLRARIGLLAHDLYVYPELSAAENLQFFARLYRLPDAARLVDAALGRANLSERRDDPVEAFSRGMRQRLAIERALLHSPRLALLDEPFTGLDDAAVGALKARLAALRESGCIVLLTTHDLEAIEGLIDRAVVLTGGRLTDVGNGAAGLRERYRRVSAAS